MHFCKNGFFRGDYVGLYDKAEDFKHFDKSVGHRVLAADAKSLHVEFQDVDAGSYALALFHDVNGNKQIDKNFFGIPQEGYAFSTNPDTFFEPTFEDAKFFVKDLRHLHVKVVYR